MYEKRTKAFLAENLKYDKVLNAPHPWSSWLQCMPKTAYLCTFVFGITLKFSILYSLARLTH